MSWTVKGRTATSSEVAGEATPIATRWLITKIILKVTAAHDASNGVQLREGTNVIWDTTEQAGAGQVDDGTVIILDYHANGGQWFKNFNVLQVGTNPGSTVTVHFA